MGDGMTSERRSRMTLPGALALMVGLTCFLPGAAGAQFGKNKVQYRNFDFKVVSSAHFDVYFYQGGDSLALRVLDLAEKTNLKLSRDMGHILTRKIPIILYNSPNDFRQTNVTLQLLSEGTGGFTEVLRNRVVLPFDGSYEGLRHVVVHELVHAFMFDMLFRGGLAPVLGRGTFFSVPLWFAEGYAEWLSEGWTPQAEMFVRDGTITGYLPPLPFAGGFLVYKEGQAAMKFIEERYGAERIRELLQKMKFHRNFDRAFEAAMGMSVQAFDAEFQTWLRRNHWPTVADRSGPEVFARPLTDHRRDASNVNIGASISPTGDRVAYFSDRGQYTDIYIISALDGQLLNRFVKGSRNVSFESLPSFRSALTWSPDGEKLAFTAQSQARDVLYIGEAESGKIVRKYKNEFDGLLYPTWHPENDSIVVVAIKDGRSDLYLVTPDGEFERLTDDTWDEKEPKWSPDGRSIVFSSDRAHPVVLTAVAVAGGFGNYGIYSLDMETREITSVLNTSGADTQPTWSPDGRRLLFVSTRNGAQDAYLFDLRDSTFIQLTNMIGGVFSLSWSRENDRVVFSAFNEGGWDVFAAKEPLSLDAVVDRLREDHPKSVFSWEEMQRRPEAVAPPPAVGELGALSPTWPDTSLTPPSSLLLRRASLADSLSRVDLSSRSRLYDTPVDTLLPVGLVAVIDTSMQQALFALPDSIMSQKPQRYRPQFTAEFANGGLQYNSAYGLAGSTRLTVSDFLGNHRIFLATDVFSSSLDETNFLAIYNYLPRRTNYGVGIFHFKNYFFSRVSSLGEAFSEPRQFSDRNFGALAFLSYPLDRFRRIELSLQQTIVRRSFFEQVGPNFIVETGEVATKVVTAPQVTFVHDTALYGFYGPVNGGRSFVSLTATIPITNSSLFYQTLAIDHRRYINLGAGYQFAMRGAASVSVGRDPQVFEIGGFSTVRGYDDFELSGTRLVFTNLELRFPFINALGVVGPLPLGFFNLRGVLFSDMAVVNNPGQKFRLTSRDGDGRRGLEDLRFSYGAGVRSAFSFLILKLDVGWRTNFRETSRPVWHFSIGPEF